MVNEGTNEEAIFDAAIQLKKGPEREAYLAQACGEDSKLRADVEALLQAHEAKSLIDEPIFDIDVTLDASPSIEGPGTKIGRYELLELIGEGGMGLVYLAGQKTPVKRQVALKIIKPGMDSRQIIARFEAEKQMLALLDHPNIARVYDAGATEGGRPYFVMEYIKGMPINDYCDQYKLNIEQRLRLFLQVCDAVQYAHQKGIIHRDIKPSNILVSVQGDKPTPKIIDFGIAKALTQQFTTQTLFTQQGQLLGTPEYMSPEQTDLATQDIDTRSDIYSLGVVLYQLLAGVLPFGRESFEKGGFAEIQRVIQEVDPPHPSTALSKLGDEAKRIAERRRTQVVPLARRLHRELEWIPLKAMRKERVRRYRSASELADDIENYLNGNPLIAGPETATYRVKKFVRRHAGSVATVILVAAAIILGLVISSAMYFRSEKALQRESIARGQAEQAEKVAQEQKNIVETKAEDLRRAMYVNSIQLAGAKYQEGNIRRVREVLNACPNDLRGWEWNRLNYVSDQSLMSFIAHPGHVNSLALSPDGKRIVSGGGDAIIKVWDIATGKELITIPKAHTNEITSVAFSPDGKRIASGDNSGEIKVWDEASGKEMIALKGHKNRIYSVAFSQDGTRIVSGSEDMTAKVWDAVTWTEITTLQMTLQGHKSGVSSVTFSPDGKRIVSCDHRGRINVWDGATCKEVMIFGGHSHIYWEYPVSFSPDSKFIVSGIDNDIKIWDATTGAKLMTLRGHTGPISSVAFSRNGKYIVSGGMDNTIKVWDTTTGEEVLTLRGHEAEVYSVAFSPDSKHIISGSWDRTIKVWDISINREVTYLLGHRGLVYSIAFSPDSKRIVSGSRDERVKVWDVASGAEVMSLPVAGRYYYSEAFAMSPDGERIATVSVSPTYERTIKVWDAVNGAALVTLSGPGDEVFSVAFTYNGKLIASLIASGSAGETVKIWDAGSGAEVLTLHGHDDLVKLIAFSPDGKRIIWGGQNGRMKVWDAANGTEVMTMTGHEGTVMCITFSPNGKSIASAGADSTAKIWDAETGSELITLRGHGDIVTSVAFSPDGRRIVSGSRDGTARLWDLMTGAELLTLRAYFGVDSLAFSPDGKTIAAGNSDGSLVLWESAAPAAGYEPRKNAEAARKVVDDLYERHGFYYEVIDKIQTDKTPDEPVRKVALQIADSRRGEDADTHRLRGESWQIINSPSYSLEDYRAALSKAEKANRLEPNNPFILDPRGVAQYRVGAYEDALKTLTSTEKIRTDTDKEPEPANLAFMAMALHQLGRTEEAKAALERLRSLLKKDERLAQVEWVKAFLAEAEKLIEGEK